MKVRLLMCSAILLVSAGCAAGARRPPASQPAAAVEGPTRHKPLHKGHIDVSSGFYVREDDDLVVHTKMPLVLRRTHLSADRISRRFGLGGSHPGEWWLHGDGDPRVSWAELILTTGARVRFTRVSEGRSHVDAVLEHRGTWTEFEGARLIWNGTGWTMQFRDGSWARFLDCNRADEICSILERTDAHGHRIEFVRNEAGLLQRMASESQSIAFDYDHARRIVRAYATDGGEVTYSYDERGRLTRASSSNGAVRTYSYNDRNELVAIRDPARIVENEFDSSGRVVRQQVRFSAADDEPFVQTFRYAVKNGRVVQTAIEDNDGTAVVYRLDARGWIASETRYAGGLAPASWVYAVDAETNQLLTVTLSCAGRAGPVVEQVTLSASKDEGVRQALMQKFCAGWR